MASLSVSFATEILELVLGQQAQPNEPVAQQTSAKLCTNNVPIPGLSAEPMHMVYDLNGNQALLNTLVVIFDTTNVVGDILADSFTFTDTGGRVLVYGDRDGVPFAGGSGEVDSTADVRIPQFGIGGGILPQANGYSSQADADSTSFGEHYLGSVMEHYFSGVTYPGSPSNLYVGLFGGQLEDYTSPPVAPTSPLSEARQPIAQNFDITTAGDQVTATYNAELRWPSTAGGTVKTVGIFDALTGGNLVAMSSVDTTVVVAGNDVLIPSGTLSLRIN